MTASKPYHERIVLITGPTTGIGRDLADRFAARGAELILVSRNAGQLEQLQVELGSRHGARAHVVPMDLSLSGAAAQLISAVDRLGLRVDVLVNNAGYGVYGKFLDEDIAPQLGMIELHAATPTRLTHHYLPGMIERGRGGVLNISSTGGFQPVGIENVYCATKTYLTHFTEALAEEVGPKSKTGVSITCVCPGPTETPFFDQPLMKTRAPAKLSRMTSSAVADLALSAFERGDILEVCGFQNKAIALATKLAPRSFVRKAARRIVERTQSGR